MFLEHRFSLERSGRLSGESGAGPGGRPSLRQPLRPGDVNCLRLSVLMTESRKTGPSGFLWIHINLKKRKPERCEMMLDVGISVRSNLETC